jgi:uncharacterized cofD-like protein
MSDKRNKKIVAMGGGNGIAQVLLGSKKYFSDLTAIVNVTDTGRSTGVARSLVDMPAPGDVRNIIGRLAEDQDSLIVKMLNDRFHSEKYDQYDGMAFGNLLLAAAKNTSGSYLDAVNLLVELARPCAAVYPVSIENTHINAELEDGTIVETELNVRGLDKSPIKRLFLQDKEAEAYQPAVDAIREADLVVIGPGSFFTTVLANLLFKGVKEALQETKGKVVFVCNTTTQPGQTDNYNILNHIDMLRQVIGENTVDSILINYSPDLSDEVLADLAKHEIFPIEPSKNELNLLEGQGYEVIVEDFAKKDKNSAKELWNKMDTVRHDKDIVGEVLSRLI